MLRIVHESHEKHERLFLVGRAVRALSFLILT